MGKEGYGRLVRSLQNLLSSVLRVAVLELGAYGTGWILGLLRDSSEMSGLSAITIHHWIAYIGMLGFAISEFLHEAQSIVRHIAEIRAFWKKGNPRRGLPRFAAGGPSLHISEPDYREQPPRT